MARGDAHKADSLAALQQHVDALRVERRRLQNRLASVTADVGRTENAIAAMQAHADATYVGAVVDAAVVEDVQEDAPQR